MLCFTAAAHFNSMRSDLVAMVPPWMPSPGLAVTITGVPADGGRQLRCDLPQIRTPPFEDETDDSAHG